MAVLDAELDAVEAAGDVSVTLVPSARVVDVVVEPSLLVIVLLVAASSAARSGSALEPLLLESLEPSALPEPSELAT